MEKIRLFRLYRARERPEAMIQIGKVNPLCLDGKDIVNHNSYVAKC